MFEARQGKGRSKEWQSITRQGKPKTKNTDTKPGSHPGQLLAYILDKEIHLEYARTAYHTIWKFSKKWDIDETYYAACKVEYQLYNQSNS